jgi:hypothetical protein
MAVFSRFSTQAKPWCAGVMLAALAGCSRGTAAPAGAPGVEASYDKLGRLERLVYDRNHDGKPDAWLKVRGAQVLSAELDDDFNGVVDRREFYADQPVAAQATPSAASLPARAEIVRAEQATGADGKLNRVEFYEHGKLARIEEDTNGNGSVDKWETWTGGVLVMVALDTKGTGKPDRRIVYAADGGEPRMEVDAKGDGTFTPLGH